MIIASAPMAITGFFETVHLGDFFVQRTTGKRDAQRVDLEPFIRFAFLFREALGTEVAIVVVAIDAVVDLTLCLARIHARVGEFEAVALTLALGRSLDAPHAIVERNDRHETLIIYAFRQTEAHPAFDFRFAFRDGQRTEAPACEFFDRIGVGLLVLEQLLAVPGDRQFAV